MHKHILFILGIALGGISVYLSHYIMARTPQSKTTNSSLTPVKKSIAIMLPVTHPSLEKIRDGFQETLQRVPGYDFSFVVYNGNGSRTLLQSQVEEAVSKDYDALFTIATSPSILAKTVTAKKNRRDLPIIYGAVSDPIASGLVESLEPSGTNITGIADTIAHDMQLDMMRAFKPEMKRVALIYDASSPGLEQEKDLVVTYAQARGIQVQPVPIFAVRDLAQKVAPFLQDIDFALVLKDNTVVSGLDMLIKLCNRLQVPLMTSDLDSPERGAALGFGVYEYDMGVAAANKVRAVLVNGTDPGAIPSTQVEAAKIKVNAAAAKRQGLDLPATTLFMLASGEVIGGI